MSHSFLVIFLSFRQGMVMLFRMFTKDTNFVMISGYESGSIMIWNIKREVAIDAKILYENPGSMIYLCWKKLPLITWGSVANWHSLEHTYKCTSLRQEWVYSHDQEHHY